MGTGQTDREGGRKTHQRWNGRCVAQRVFSSRFASCDQTKSTKVAKEAQEWGWGGGTAEDNNEEDEKFCESQEGSVGRGQSVGMDGKPGVRFRKAERKTMRMEQLSIKSGNRVGRKRVFLKETRQKAVEKSLDRVRGKAGGGGDSTGQRCAGELSD